MSEMNFQEPGENEQVAQALCEEMGDNWKLAQEPGGLAPWYRKLAYVALRVREVSQ